MKALISVINKQEVQKVIEVGCDILDIKNPLEGSLGANYPWVIKEIIEIVPQSKNIEVSITVGDVPNLPGTISLAVLGALQFKPDYIKVGLKGPKTKSEAINLMKKIIRTIKTSSSNSKIVAAGYADYNRIGSLNPLSLPEIAYKSGASAALIDTAIKDGKNLLDFISEDMLKKFVDDAHTRGLKAALAGSLNEEHIEIISNTGADIFGVRGAICFMRKREAKIKIELLKEFCNRIKSNSRNSFIDN